MRRRFGRRHPFGAKPPRSPVKESHGVQKGRASKCATCGGRIEPGDAFIRLRLSKRWRHPCATCGTQPRAAKRFHPSCKPTDVYKAMGVNPNQQPGHMHNPPPGQPIPPSMGGAVPPPPKPKTPDELALEALVTLEAALIAKVRPKMVIKDGKLSMPPELEAMWKKMQGLKARVLRPGTPAEGEVATSLLIQQLVKAVYA